MDQAENTIKEYFEVLPESFKKAIASFDWQKKVAEVGQKYSLSQTQVFDLGYEVLFVLVGIEDDNDLSTNTQEKLGVTSIVGDEIASELEEKVLAVIADLATKEDNRKIETVTRSPIPKVIVPQKPTDLPQDIKPKYPVSRPTELSDITPDNLPVSDEDEKILHPEISIPRYIPTKVEEVKAEEDKKYEDLKQFTATEMQAENISPSEAVSRIKYRPAGTLSANPIQEIVATPQTSITQEYVQKPQSVPRLNFNSDTPQAAPQNPAPSIESRWDDAFKNAPTESTPSPAPAMSEAPLANAPQPEIKPVQPKVDSPITKSYSVDPYREPIQ